MRRRFEHASTRCAHSDAREVARARASVAMDDDGDGGDDDADDGRRAAARARTDDSRLDFASSDFDPVLALKKSSNATPPFPRMRALDTVRQCRRLLPSTGEKVGREHGAGRQTRGLASFAAQARAKQRAERFTKEDAAFAKRERLCDALANSKHAREGPLRVLRDARERRERVTIVTRHSRGVRGVATAYVEAFDKFANMILTDVEETYTVRVMRVVERERTGTTDVVGGHSRTQTRCAPKLERRARRLQQIFVRGEQIVSVSIPPS